MARNVDTCVTLAIVLLLVFTATGSAEWYLGQNDPDPFCNDPQSPQYSCTWFNIWGQPTAEIVFEIWDPDTTGVLVRRDLGEVAPGSHVMIWYGTDDMDTVLPQGGYPFRMAVTERGGRPVTFSDWHVAHISCDTPVESLTWTRIKSLYK